MVGVVLVGVRMAGVVLVDVMGAGVVLTDAQVLIRSSLVIISDNASIRDGELMLLELLLELLVDGTVVGICEVE